MVERVICYRGPSTVADVDELPIGYGRGSTPTCAFGTDSSRSTVQTTSRRNSPRRGFPHHTSARPATRCWGRSATRNGRSSIPSARAASSTTARRSSAHSTRRFPPRNGARDPPRGDHRSGARDVGRPRRPLAQTRQRPRPAGADFGAGALRGPREAEDYYKEKQRHALLSGDAPPREVLENQVDGEFLVEDDPRTTDALKGYALQASHYLETGEAFLRSGGLSTLQRPLPRGSDRRATARAGVLQRARAIVRGMSLTDGSPGMRCGGAC